MSTATAKGSFMGFAVGRGSGVHLDGITLAITLGLVLLGLVMVTSASVSIASQEINC